MLRAHRVKRVNARMAFACSMLVGVLVKQVDLLIPHSDQFFCSGTPTKEALSVSTPK